MLGTINPADLMTKHLPAGTKEKHCTRSGMQFRSGRAESAPTLRGVMGGKAFWGFEVPDIIVSDRENGKGYIVDEEMVA